MGSVYWGVNNIMIIKPMLAATINDINFIKYPVALTPKLDGIRCLKIDGIAVSRKFKPIPNVYCRQLVQKLPDGVDGELVLRDSTFQQTTSYVMTKNNLYKNDNLEYHIFDYVQDGLDKPYMERINDLSKLPIQGGITYLYPFCVDNINELLKYQANCLTSGYQGIMIRSIDGPYKCGRSTLNQGYLSKLKRFNDGQAIIIGFNQLMHNSNQAKTNKFGYTQRSLSKKNLVPADTLGSVIVFDPIFDCQFNIGSGFDDSMRFVIWNNKEEYLGKLVKYKYQRAGVKNAPRFPIFLGIRSEEDL